MDRDRDVDLDADLLIATLTAHAAGVAATHDDREAYGVELRAPMTLDKIAALAARD